VQASKNGGAIHPFLPKCQEVLHNTQKLKIKIKIKKTKKLEKGGQSAICQARAMAQAPFFYTFFPLFLPATPIFFHMWSTPPHWLQLMPALPRRLLKFSNIHNFLSVAYKMMKFVPM
jgi:hypothetical protein